MKKRDSKTNYLMWWGIALLVFVLFAVFVGNNEGSQTPLETEDEISEVEKTVDEEESNSE